MGYKIKRVDEIKFAKKQERPKIDSKAIEKFLDVELQKQFDEWKKIQATDKDGNPKFRKDKDGNPTDKPQPIGFMGALRTLEREHPDSYKKLVEDVEKAEKSEKPKSKK